MSDTEKSGGAARGKAPSTRRPERGRCICGHRLSLHTDCDEFMRSKFPRHDWNGCEAPDCGCFFFRQEDDISIGLADGSLRLVLPGLEASKASDPEGVPQSPSEK